MRKQQLNSLNETELSLLFYVMNDRGLKNPPIETIEEILWHKHDAILWKVSQIESSLNDEGKIVFASLMKRLNMNPYQEAEEYSKALQAPQSEYQLEFNF